MRPPLNNPETTGTTALHCKKNHMYIALMVSWFSCILWFSPRLFSLFSIAGSIYARVALGLFILCLYIFWFYGNYYLMLIIFDLRSPRSAKTFRSFQPAAPAAPVSGEQPKVAVLYLAMNDFQYRAAFSCLDQDYTDYHLYILDDSTEEESMREVDRFKDRFPQKVTVIRRKNREGFKAGNINHALQHYVKDADYFAVIDSDGVIPVDFLTRSIPYFALDPHIGFVQGSHRPNPMQESRFASDLALGIIPLWTAYFEPRNKHGFVSFLGHSGVIRRSAWEKAGGFPEVVSEDLAFSTKLAEIGYRGYFAGDIISCEDFPGTYPQLRKQKEKYVKGGCQYLHRCVHSFLKSKNASWFEKLDVLISCSTLFLPAFNIFFLFVFCLILPLAFAETKPLHLSLFNIQFSGLNAIIMKGNFGALWEWDFYLLTLAMMFAPVLGCIRLVFSHPIKLIRLLFLSAVPYLSLMIVCAAGILNYIATGKAAFPVTGDKKENTPPGFHCNHRAIYIIELTVGLFFSYLCIKTLNLSLLAFSLSLMLGYFLNRYGWDNKWLKVVLYGPFALVLISVVLTGANLMGVQGVFLLFFGLHF